MTLDGDKVRVGDLVFDILLGISGSVVTVSSNNFTVRFGAGRQLTYHGNGEMATVKRAYWRNPVLFVPRKNEPRWNAIQAAAAIVRDAP